MAHRTKMAPLGRDVVDILFHRRVARRLSRKFAMKIVQGTSSVFVLSLVGYGNQCELEPANVCCAIVCVMIMTLGESRA